MKFKNNIEMVYVDWRYLKYLNAIDSEVFFSESDSYKKKPHVGILITKNNYEYVIPLTSAKDKHRKWKDVDAGYFRIFEIVDIRNYIARKNDILVDIVNKETLNKLPSDDRVFYKQKILSVLDIRKMFPVKAEVYSRIPMEYNLFMTREEINRRNLLMKEWQFLRNIKDKIEEKCDKIYTKQISNNKILKFYCNYKLLEKACDKYNSIG